MRKEGGGEKERGRGRDIEEEEREEEEEEERVSDGKEREKESRQDMGHHNFSPGSIKNQKIETDLVKGLSIKF